MRQWLSGLVLFVGMVLFSGCASDPLQQIAMTLDTGRYNPTAIRQVISDQVHAGKSSVEIGRLLVKNAGEYFKPNPDTNGALMVLCHVDFKKAFVANLEGYKTLPCSIKLEVVDPSGNLMPKGEMEFKTERLDKDNQEPLDVLFLFDQGGVAGLYTVRMTVLPKSYTPKAPLTQQVSTFEMVK